jgi:Gluconolactonase
MTGHSVRDKYIAIEPQTVDYFHMIPQRGVKHKIFDEGHTHNAIWDFTISPQGRKYFSLCSELYESEYGRLYEYIEEKNQFKLCFNLKDVIMPQERAIRASKIHTSISFLSCGKMLMTTHTTDKSPSHPAWMPEAYYYHLWEGYQGSNIILYDPLSEKAENLGIPVPHESIYGGIYDKKHNAFYFIGLLRGHLYRFDLDTKKVTDLGQATEFASFRFLTGSDGNIYSATRSGYLYRINVDTGRIEDMNIRFPEYDNKWNICQRQLNFGTNGPDGRMYFGVVFCDDLLAYDPSANRLEKVGSYKPSAFYPSPACDTISGMDFDESGCLWYGILMFEKNLQSVGTRLMKWDIMNERQPQHIGLFGSLDRNVACISELYIRNNILYASDTNHANDAPGIITVDLKELSEDIDKPRESCRDTYTYLFVENGEELYPGKDFCNDIDKYIQFLSDIEEYNTFISKNNYMFKTDKVDLIRIWKAVNADESSVQGVFWDDSGNLQGICGNTRQYWFLICNGKLEKIKGLDMVEPEQRQYLVQKIKPEISNDLNVMNYPAYPGRQYIAKPSACANWNTNRFIVGTMDGMLAIVNNDTVFSLGPAAPNGPIHCITTNAAGTVAYGVAGDEQDLGMVFSYDDTNGLRWLGCVHFCETRTPGVAASCMLSCCALSSDGSVLAIGSKDRMGCVYLYHIA